MKNIFKGKRGKRKNGKIQTKIEVKHRSGDTDIDDIINKIEAEKIARDYGERGKDKESELEKKHVEKLAIRSEKESKTSEASTKSVNSKLNKKSDKLKPKGELKVQKFEMASNQIINNKVIKRKVAENEKIEIDEVNKVQHITGEVKLWLLRQKLKLSCEKVVTLRTKNMRVKKSRTYKDVNQ